jgi:hypothetical protein
VGLAAFGRHFDLCLSDRRFADDITFREFYDDLNITLYGKGGNKSSVPLASLDLKYVVGFVMGEAFSGVDGFMMGGAFFGSVYVDDQIFFADPVGVGGNNSRTFSMFNNPEEEVGDDFKASQVQLQPALDAFIAKFRRSLVAPQVLSPPKLEELLSRKKLRGSLKRGRRSR